MDHVFKMLFYLCVVLICVTSTSENNVYHKYNQEAIRRYKRLILPSIMRREQLLLKRSNAIQRHNYGYVTSSMECCPSVMELIQPKGGVSKYGRILELYSDVNSTQSFYQISCREGVKGRNCLFLNSMVRSHSRCVQKYTYSYALVREFGVPENTPWRLDYIRVRSGCSCEIRRPTTSDIRTFIT